MAATLGTGLLAGWPRVLRAQEQSIAHATLPPCVAGDPDLLLPDLVPDAPTDVRNMWQGGHRVLQFTTAVGNIGDGPLVLEGRIVSTPDGVFTQGYQVIWRRDGSRCARQTGRFVYHPTHQHFHFDAFVGYELRTGDPRTGALAATGSKASFCLLDIRNIRGYPFQLFPRQVTNDTCASPEGIQGISVGWKDVYERYLPGQSLDLDRSPDEQVPAGGYFLLNSVDPTHLLWDKDPSNNTSYTTASVPIPPPAAAVVVPTPRPIVPKLRPGRVRPVRAARPTRIPRFAPVAPPTPTPTATMAVPATAPPVPAPPAATDCAHACPRSISQMRMLWYGGLSFSAVIGRGGCEPLRPEPGATGTLRMSKFVTAQRQDTGHEHTASFVLGANGVGTTSLDGTVQFSRVVDSYNFSYSAPVPSFANMRDGQDFPVAFDLCLTLGQQAVKMHMVCQPKSQGMLCHEG